MTFKPDPSLVRREILRVLAIAQTFDSAFTREQVRAFLRLPIPEKHFRMVVETLKAEHRVWERQDRLGSGKNPNGQIQRSEWSYRVFVAYRKHLKWIVRLPWVRYVALTGANAFESCDPEDDVDLFVITCRDRLWLTYGLIVILSRWLGVREKLCVNFLVDEANLELTQQNYFTALQIVQMQSLINHGYKIRFMKKNRWIFRELPNAAIPRHPNPRYYLGRKNGFWANRTGKWLTCWNRWVYQWYRNRLQRKFPDVFDRNIVVRPGYAKLNRVDYQNVYRLIDSGIRVRGELKAAVYREAGLTNGNTGAIKKS